jgi:hypothetical protein
LASASPTGDWSPAEVTALVADYFDMLRLELCGEAYSKTARRKALLERLAPGRNDASVEFKHANLSAVLVGLGLPSIGGYKPRGNFRNRPVTGWTTTPTTSART